MEILLLTFRVLQLPWHLPATTHSLHLSMESMVAYIYGSVAPCQIMILRPILYSGCIMPIWIVYGGNGIITQPQAIIKIHRLRVSMPFSTHGLILNPMFATLLVSAINMFKQNSMIKLTRQPFVETIGGSKLKSFQFPFLRI